MRLVFEADNRMHEGLFATVDQANHQSEQSTGSPLSASERATVKKEWLFRELCVVHTVRLYLAYLLKKSMSTVLFRRQEERQMPLLCAKNTVFVRFFCACLFFLSVREHELRHSNELTDSAHAYNAFGSINALFLSSLSSGSTSCGT